MPIFEETVVACPSYLFVGFSVLPRCGWPIALRTRFCIGPPQVFVSTSTCDAKGEAEHVLTTGPVPTGIGANVYFQAGAASSNGPLKLTNAAGSTFL